MSILSTKNLSKSYNEKIIIENINITLEENQVVSIIGKSGSGKSTLFNVLSGIELKTSGEILINNIVDDNTLGKLSYMQQTHLLLPFKTILENVISPLILKGYEKDKAIEIAVSHFKDFDIEGSENKYPRELSGGMCQRVSLLRAFLFNSNLMLLDEPFSSLDTITKRNMYKWYNSFSKKNKTSCLLITHDIKEAILLSNKIYIIGKNPGQIVEEIIIENNYNTFVDFENSVEFMSYYKKIIDIIDKY